MVGDEEKIEYNEDSVIVYYKKVEGVETSFQAKIARLYVTSLFLDNTLFNIVQVSILAASRQRQH